MQYYNREVEGLGKLAIKGKVTVSYNITNDENDVYQLIIANVYYVPSMTIRLVSPQQIESQSKDPEAGIVAKHHTCMLIWDYHSKTINYHDTTKLPVIYTCPGIKRYNAYLTSISSIPGVTHQVNHTAKSNRYKTHLSNKTWELISCRERLGHISVDTIKFLSKLDYLPKKISDADKPICASCQYGKASKRPAQYGTIGKHNNIREPGDLFHMDQAESSTPGRPLNYSGRNNKMFIITLFVDLISKKIFVEFQQTTSTNDTLENKRIIEA